jgi:tetratricopeptide (TPR) repeat protein
MAGISRWRRPVVLGIGAAGLLAGAAYLGAFWQLSAASRARRSDSYAEAERRLAACWRLPGLKEAISFEHELVSVQQGDLRAEKAWQARGAADAAHGALILEALAKGNLAAFRWNEARDYTEAILNRQPAHAQALWLRGRAWVKLQQEPQALEDFSQALRTEPASFEIRLSRADLLHKLGHVRDADSIYSQLWHERPQDARVVLALGHCRQEEGLQDDARNVVDDLLKSQPNLVAALVERGRIAIQKGQLEDAERWLRKAVERGPDHAEACFVLQRCLDILNKDDASLAQRVQHNEERQAALRLKIQDAPNDPALLTQQGRWVLRAGQWQEAVGWFYLALAADPKFVPAHLALADYFALAQQPRRAAEHARLAGTVANPAAVAAQHRHQSRVVLNALPPPTEASADDVHRLCAACHAYPPPESFPKSAWRKEVKQGFDLLRDAPREGDFPSLESVVLYYEKRAAERLPPVDRAESKGKSPFRFQPMRTGWMPNVPPYPGIANLHLAPLLGGDKLELLASDTRLNRVLMMKPYGTTAGAEILPEITGPCHTAVADLDGDGKQDILVASLGQFYPTDAKVGSVVLLRGLSGGKFERHTLLSGVGRVSDVQAADFSGDGKLDLIVAVFGWRRTGEILYLENRTTSGSVPEFERFVVEVRHGAIHVPVVDLNRDGHLDFVALLSQEHETVVAYLNEGNGAFHPETIFVAPHPAYGSSGIEVTDLDGDGDFDVLLTNGDVLDRPYLLKPYHGIQWLENEGSYPFSHCPLAAMYGASRAVAADFDGDQDLDVAAVSFLPRLEFPEREQLRLPSLVLLEQTARAQFAAHVLETGVCDHFTCAAGDWDGDGWPDLAVGNFSWKRSQPMSDAAVLWKNLGKP